MVDAHKRYAPNDPNSVLGPRGSRVVGGLTPLVGVQAQAVGRMRVRSLAQAAPITTTAQARGRVRLRSRVIGGFPLQLGVLLLTGQVYVAPTGTPGPTSVDSTLNAAFLDLGFISEDGVTFHEELEVVEKSSWASLYPKEIKVVGRQTSVEFVLREYNKRAVEFALEGTVTGSFYYTLIASDSPSGYWRMEEASGSLSPHVGTISLSEVGSHTYQVAGHDGFGITFPGSGGSRFQAPSASDFAFSAVSIEAWIKTTDTVGGAGGYAGIVTKQFAWGMFNKAGTLQCFDWAAGGDANLTGGFVADGLWHHVVFTLSGSTANVYQDGVNVATKSTFAISNQTIKFVVGEGNDSVNSQPFNGTIDEPAVYNFALSPTEVLEHYQNKGGWEKAAYNDAAVRKAMVVDARDNKVKVRLYFPEGIVQADVESSASRGRAVDLPISYGASRTDADAYAIFVEGVEELESLGFGYEGGYEGGY